MKTFRLLTAVSIAALVAASSAASAQQRTLYVAGYGGSFEKTIRDEVIPAFEKENRRQGRIRRRQLHRHAGQASGAEGQPADRRRHRR
ncbi:ABC-type tungstate transport system permease subunit [Bradyrhizobium diazoefficiens]